MDRPNYDQSIQHFSHPHPLEFSDLQQQEPTYNLPPCAACKLQPYGLIYICKTCNFILHISCSEKPQLINHPSDPTHPITLLPFPAYPDGAFTCDACGLRDTGFSYHCRACTLDLHIHCASMPMTLNHPTHHHTLTLTTRPPPKEIIYTCSLCRGLVVNQWTYDCRACNFGFHVSCANNPHAHEAANNGAAPHLINNQPNAGVNPLPSQLSLQGSRNAVMLMSPASYYVYETPRPRVTSSKLQSLVNSIRLQASRNKMMLRLFYARLVSRKSGRSSSIHWRACWSKKKRRDMRDVS